VLGAFFVADSATPVLDKVSGIIADPQTWRQTPGSIDGGVPPTPGDSGLIRAEIEKEYVAAGVINWYTNYTRILPWTVDDLTTRFGDDLYERMMYDPAVVSAVNVYRTAVLQEGCTFTPAITSKTESGYAEAVAYVRRAEQMIEEMESSIDDDLWDLELACALGNRVAEETWHLDRTFTGRQEWRIVRLNLKPRVTTAFAVDVHKNILGLLGLIPGIGFPVQLGTILTDPAVTPNLLPRDKFVIRTFRPRDNDPRGTSMVRPAYTAWNLKMQLWPEYLKWLTQFASPSLIGTTAMGAQVTVKQDEEGNPVLDANGNPVLVYPEQLMADALADLKNSTAVAFPFGAEVKPIEMRGQGGPFLNAFHFLNEEITQAIQHQPLTTTSAQYGTRSQATVHENVADTIVKQGKKAVCRMIRWDILRRWIRYNDGPEFAPLAPMVSLGDTEAQNWSPKATAIAQLQTAGYLDTSQMPGLDQELGLPVRAAGWEQRMAKANAAQSGHIPGQSDNPSGARNGAVRTAA